ncbi:anti-sigma factor, partial [Agromyces binzhouensis]
AAVLVIAGAVVGVNWPGPAGWGAQRSVQAIAEAPDAESVTVASADGGEVTIVWSEELGRSAVRASDLPEVGSASTYELWYIDEGGARPAGTFDPDAGEAFVVLEGDFTPGVVVGMTVEPAGGSEAPTTDPIVVVET